MSITAKPDSAEARRRGVTVQHLFVEPDAEQLLSLARMVDAGRLRPHIQQIYGLAEAAEAHKIVAAGHVRGKLVLNL